MGKNDNLHTSKSNKIDEFYTQLVDIEKEMKYYKDFFKGKVVYCNCDDPLSSNFTKYFILQFKNLELKELICTFYDIENKKMAFTFHYYGDDMNGDGVINEKDIEIITKYKTNYVPLIADKGFDFERKEECWKKGIYGSGDFRSKHCIEYLKQADVVVTNPPFSLFREYVKQLMDYNKKFIIIGNMNSITYKEIFPYIKDNKIWMGVSLNGTKCSFIVPNSYNGNNTYYGDEGEKLGKINNACWFTNIDNKRRNEEIELYKTYNPIEYPKYDNYDAIEVSKVEKIPADYDGVMGVPITFLFRYNPKQFEIIDINPHFYTLIEKGLPKPKQLSLKNIGKKDPFARILIKKLF